MLFASLCYKLSQYLQDSPGHAGLGGGGGFPQIYGSGGEFQYAMKKITQLDLHSFVLMLLLSIKFIPFYGLVKMRSQKDLRTMKKGVNRIEDQGEN